jgi:hypothetical protein
MERWRVIRKFPEYEISNLGNVRTWKKDNFGNKPKLEPWFPKIFLNSRGVPCVKLRYNSEKPKQVNVCYLVAEAFIKNRFGLSYRLVHLNGNELDNRVENLAYMKKTNG